MFSVKETAPCSGAQSKRGLGEVVALGATVARQCRREGFHARIIPASSSQGNGSETAGSFFQGGLRW